MNLAKTLKLFLASFILFMGSIHTMENQKKLKKEKEEIVRLLAKKIGFIHTIANQNEEELNKNLREEIVRLEVENLDYNNAMKDPEKLRKEIERLTVEIKEDPKNPNAYGCRSSCYIKLKQYDEAEKDLTAEIKICDLGFPELYLKRASVYVEQKQYDKAARDLRTAKELALFKKDKRIKSIDKLIKSINYRMELNKKVDDYSQLLNQKE